jgi:hypothetical protein
MPKYCPKNCNGAEKLPRELTPQQVEWIAGEIAGKKYKQLPELALGEHFFACSHCHVVWKTTDQRSSDSDRRVLGRLTRVGHGYQNQLPEAGHDVRFSGSH